MWAGIHDALSRIAWTHPCAVFESVLLICPSNRFLHQDLQISSHQQRPNGRRSIPSPLRRFRYHYPALDLHPIQSTPGFSRTQAPTGAITQFSLSFELRRLSNSHQARDDPTFRRPTRLTASGFNLVLTRLSWSVMAGVA